MDCFIIFAVDVYFLKMKIPDWSSTNAIDLILFNLGSASSSSGGSFVGVYNLTNLFEGLRPANALFIPNFVPCPDPTLNDSYLEIYVLSLETILIAFLVPLFKDIIDAISSFFKFVCEISA
jgi:hypothetical protein